MNRPLDLIEEIGVFVTMGMLCIFLQMRGWSFIKVFPICMLWGFTARTLHRAVKGS